VHGALDGAVNAASTATTPPGLITGELRHAVLTKAGHFPHEELPEQFNRLLLDWLAGLEP
jgi:pimeloyl-ACP methyl ester carboxylesterase